MILLLLDGFLANIGYFVRILSLNKMQQFKARLGYNKVTKFLWRLTREPSKETEVTIPGLLKTSAVTLLFTSGILLT